jgi:hypothetical protein
MGPTGLIPESFADQFIRFRIPYIMPGEKITLENTAGDFFPEGVFLHNVNKPFEIHSVSVRLTLLDEETPPALIDAQPVTLGRRVRLSVTDTSKNEPLTKAPTLVDNLINSVQGSEGQWIWPVPYTIVRQEGLQVQIDVQSLAGMFNQNGEQIQTQSVRVELAFQGYLLIVAPASNTR